MMVSKDILIEELVEQHPTAVGFLIRKGIVCIQCGEPIWGTLEEASKKKKIDNIDDIITELNEYLGLKG